MTGKEIIRSATDDRADAARENEHQTYLRVAAQVLETAMSPLRVREIVDRAIDRGLFGDHALSRTPEKSMQARLSTDILTKGQQSSFVRTARGFFTLRSKLNTSSSVPQHSEDTSDIYAPQEYVASRRILRTPSENVLCTHEREYAGILTFQGIDADTSPILDRLLGGGNILYIPRDEAEVRNDAKQFITYVLVQCEHRLLYFRRSYLSRAAEFLRGAKCIGFGGHVTAADHDILSFSDFGLSACARRELTEELSLPTSNAATGLFRNAASTLAHRSTIRFFQKVPLELLGILNDDSSEVGRRHVAVVYRAWLSDWKIVKLLQKGESSIKGLSWIDLTRDRIELAEFEYWSQLCLRKFHPSTVVAKAQCKLLNADNLSHAPIIVISGRIGSGKSETAKYLTQRLGWPLVKTGTLLQELMGSPPIVELGREEFQARALEFITRPDGPRRFAACLAEHFAATGRPRCIIDGVRHLATYEHLSNHFQNGAGLIFIQTPPDVAYELYRSRERGDDLTFSYRDFLRVYDAPVESEIPSLGRKAQVYIYNEFGMDAFRRTLDEVATKLV